MRAILPIRDAVGLVCSVLLGLVTGSPLNATDFGFAHTEHSNLLATQAQGIKGRPNPRTQRQDYTRGDVPGPIGARREKLNARSSARAGEYTYTLVDVPGAVFTGLKGINSRGQTVGEYVDETNITHAFVRNVDGSIITIDYPGAIFTTANGINSEGSVVGRW
jgi:hypothetical protein